MFLVPCLCCSTPTAPHPHPNERRMCAIEFCTLFFKKKFVRKLPLCCYHFMIFCLEFDTMRISHWLCHKNWEEIIFLHILNNKEELIFPFYILLQQFYLTIIMDFRLFFVEGFSVLLSWIHQYLYSSWTAQFVFSNGQMDLERLKDLVRVVGKHRLVLDLSCRKKVQ